MSAGNGKGYGEGNVHAERWRRTFGSMATDALLKLWNDRTILPGGRLTAYHAAMERELKARGCRV